MAARNHHFISQTYLRGFAADGKLVVLDCKTHKSFVTTPRNVGSERDFNRIDVEGVDPELLENEMGKIETVAALAIAALTKGAPFEGNVKRDILTLAALFHIRSPTRRENWRQFRAEVAEKMMRLVLATPERYERQIQRMKEDGVDVREVSYKEMKDFLNRKEYTIELARESHFRTEMVGIEAVMPSLLQRHWVLVESSPESGPFITSDHPVNLTWRNPEKILPLYRQSPGHGHKDTRVWFPLTQRLALLGEYDAEDIRGTAPHGMVASFNSLTGLFAQRQIYTPTLDFWFVDGENAQRTGHELLAQMQKQPPDDGAE